MSAHVHACKVNTLVGAMTWFSYVHMHVVRAFNLPALASICNFGFLLMSTSSILINIQRILLVTVVLALRILAGLKLLMLTGCRVIFYAQNNLLCMDGSDHNYNQWKYIELKCDAYFLHKPSIILYDQSGLVDDTNAKWEKWGQFDYTQRNLVWPLLFQQPAEISVQPVGTPLCYAPEAPQLKKMITLLCVMLFQHWADTTEVT